MWGFPLIFLNGPDAEMRWLFPFYPSEQTCILNPVFSRFFNGYWSCGAHISFTACGDDYLNFRWVFYFHFLWEFYIRSGFLLLNRSRTTACDLRTIVEVVSTWLMSPECVTTGVQTSSWVTDSQSVADESEIAIEPLTGYPLPAQQEPEMSPFHPIPQHPPDLSWLCRQLVAGKIPNFYPTKWHCQND